jgi:hypothetical protein
MATQELANLVLDFHAENLLARENVVHAAVIGKKGNKKFVIEVGVLDIKLHEFSLTEMEEETLPAHAPIPSELSLPGARAALVGASSEDSVPVQVVEVPPVTASANTARHRPAMGGDSIGTTALPGSGTLGLAGSFASKDGTFLITNWHVLIGQSGKVGDGVLQQSIEDGGKAPADVIAKVAWSSLTTKVDVALAKVLTAEASAVTSGKTRCFGLVKGKNLAPQVDDSVKKCGRTTDGTNGKILSTKAAVKVTGPYPGGSVNFVDQLMLTGMGAGGDSGSIVLDDNDKVVGLYFADNASQSGPATRSWANRWDNVDAALPTGAQASSTNFQLD